MQIHIPDPAFASSERARANFRLAVRIALGFVALIWVIELLNWSLDLEAEDFGVRPRQLAGLPGILFAPLVHGGFAHLIANSPRCWYWARRCCTSIRARLVPYCRRSTWGQAPPCGYSPEFRNSRLPRP